ncbi:helix-turn-helix transcriptional regulator [Clostridium cylindrosporum]|uniref:Putative transcriptional regulator n=1 Tax=Clostridium cylindrosporum DSM 605 TaxID=1121307 RepID=A0A0J8DBD0_CLOCY|nr:YafY family protein [Clostridium cylindrosporum]KMT23375.1 putative transcriptional regulator [Clostridium cylindrosporum DSM 605]
MQISRLLEMVFILLNKKVVTARELSEYFEVSVRTIYRDVDALNEAGIPVYANRGKGGGISILDNYVLNKSILSEKEQVDILSSLQGLNALSTPDVEPILRKLQNIFKKENVNWIDVDLSHWGSENFESEKFSLLKTAILNKSLISFEYFSSSGESTQRIVEPLRIVFKGQGWYLYGFCRVKNDFRMFKITRLKELSLSKEYFKREVQEQVFNDFKNIHKEDVKTVLRIHGKMSYRIYDEFHEKQIEKSDDGTFTITVNFPESEWLYSYILSYGDAVEVLEPKYIREIIKVKLQEAYKKYL